MSLSRGECDREQRWAAEHGRRTTKNSHNAKSVLRDNRRRQTEEASPENLHSIPAKKLT
ncbi:hypothetical protein Fmac_007829 [Flemingia macrophylla]|uniref:Uncharacterized protein n=1 Tax=Flemingia macrophylla TaxID=520843 RepID=A0ABD1MVP6_9FABA